MKEHSAVPSSRMECCPGCLALQTQLGGASTCAESGDGARWDGVDGLPAWTGFWPKQALHEGGSAWTGWDDGQRSSPCAELLHIHCYWGWGWEKCQSDPGTELRAWNICCVGCGRRKPRSQRILDVLFSILPLNPLKKWNWACWVIPQTSNQTSFSFQYRRDSWL